MKILLRVMGVIFVVMGLVWVGQGLNLVPGTFMSGQTFWAVLGGIQVVLGVGLLLVVRKV